MAGYRGHTPQGLTQELQALLTGCAHKRPSVGAHSIHPPCSACHSPPTLRAVQVCAQSRSA